MICTVDETALSTRTVRLGGVITASRLLAAALKS
jgi:hypothetical protein